jgi:hypothetical protein
MTTFINPYGLRNEQPGPKLFLYTVDFGWSGCVGIIATSREEASRLLHDKNVKNINPHDWNEQPVQVGAYFEGSGE